MAKVRSAGGNCLSGSILEQLEHVFREATNDYSFNVRSYRHAGLCISSHRTAREYYRILRALVTYVHEEFGVDRLDKIRPQHIEAFIKRKSELSPKQLKNISSAIGKLESILSGLFGLSVDYGNRSKGTGRFLANELARSRKRDKSKKKRSFAVQPGYYLDPKALVQRLVVPEHRLVAALQWKTGMTVGEVQSIDNSSFHIVEKMKNDLFGIYDEEGIIYGIEVVGSNRKSRIVEVPRRLWKEVKTFVRKHGKIVFDHRDYLEELGIAALESGQPYHGSIGLVYSFVREASEILYRKDYGYYTALAILKRQLGVRSDRTVRKYFIP